MSTQLILYPQHYTGQHDVTTTTYTIGSNEFIVDGINFSTINASSTYEQYGNFPTQVITNAPPVIVNTWYRFRTPDIPPQPLYPTELLSHLAIPGVATGALQNTSGIYQRVSNLVIGQTYDVTIVVASAVGSRSITVWTWNGNTPHTQPGTLINPAVAGTFTESFTANAIEITIGIITAGTTVSNMLISSVDDFKNTAEQVQSYSKAFKLPGTKRNNLIFDNIFDVTRADDGIVFNPYVKTKSVLKQDGFILFEGYLRLIDIQEKQGEVSYNVNLYSEVVALADMLSDATFADLGFEENQYRIELEYNKFRNYLYQYKYIRIQKS